MVNDLNPSKKVYLFEISIASDKKNIFVIMFPNYEDPHVYLFGKLPHKIFCKLLNESSGMYSDFILSNIEVRYNRIWIHGFHGKSKDPRFVNARASIDQSAVDAAEADT